MKLAIVANDMLRDELLSNSKPENTQIFWLKTISDLKNYPDAEAVIDLLFIDENASLISLNDFLPKPVIIHSVLKPLAGINPDFIRINGWPTFLIRELIECSSQKEENKTAGEKVFAALGKKATWVPDIPGFITTRIIVQIINEAYLALEEKVSSKEEIDTAMKLGTNYPYGPFEWAGKIGLKNILDLLNRLSETEDRYKPAPLLIKETENN